METTETVRPPGGEESDGWCLVLGRIYMKRFMKKMTECLRFRVTDVDITRFSN